MFDEALNQQFAGQQAELNRALYRRWVLERELGKLEEDITRIEAGLAELERVRRAWATEKAIQEAGKGETPDKEDDRET